MADLVLAGVRLPFLFGVLLAAGAAHLLLDRLLARLGVYGWVWHPGLFRVAVFCALFAAAGLLFYP
ncbi:DUF1656 domain-containing protein [Parasulfuritortus cantonensis]|uniref:DUF1656 domain-containing protein n=1 Tax=Parasulfuritortus cantonensis TaxID=2528202 RepID=A0A4R1BLV4_9PROT|nr:DUF1656 domain-containing protein [Parasulfuritortus cantonensis]TCJ18393.1 DUF1656 domain-containing protein [Parasulfuritortus cantonensis]